MKAHAEIPLRTDTEVPLCVDLDGTLVKSDLLVESFFALIKRNPITLLHAPLWLLRGKAYLKERIAMQVDIEADTLPYDDALLERLRLEKEHGRQLVLVTASHCKFADCVESHLGLFDQVLATEDGVNLTSERKRNRLVEKFGTQGFDYVGNERADIPVWAAARESWLVDTSPSLRRAAERVATIAMEFQIKRNYLASLVKALRMHQWLKNVLVFVPLIAAHQVDQLDNMANAILAFLAFGLCASSVYLLNDLLDLSADRRHPRKRYRPFATGAIPVSDGLILMPVLLVAAILLTVAFLPTAFFYALFSYYVITLVYSFWAKERVVLDILFLTGLYTMRLIAGAAATAIDLSFWLLGFSVFLFLSLALIKRYSEMLAMQQAGRKKSAGRGYTVDDIPLIQSMGISSGYMAVLVLALYINSPDVRQMYGDPQTLWALCPLLLFWISRIWIKTHRGEMHYDPVVFAAKDRFSQLAGVFVAAVLWLSL